MFAEPSSRITKEGKGRGNCSPESKTCLFLLTLPHHIPLHMSNTSTFKVRLHWNLICVERAKIEDKFDIRNAMLCKIYKSQRKRIILSQCFCFLQENYLKNVFLFHLSPWDVHICLCLYKFVSALLCMDYNSYKTLMRCNGFNNYRSPMRNRASVILTCIGRIALWVTELVLLMAHN